MCCLNVFTYIWLYIHINYLFLFFFFGFTLFLRLLFMCTVSPEKSVVFFSYQCLHAETGNVDQVLIERYNTPGFVGCLSRVQFNGFAPLKSALRTSSRLQVAAGVGHIDTQSAVTSQVSYHGKLVESNCGASPLTIPPMSAATDPWRLDNTGLTSPWVFWLD